jgi:hypothetical protein
VHPTVVDIWKIDRAVRAFLVTRKADRAPERLHVSKHFGSEGPDASHPIAVQTPNKVVSNEASKFLTRDIDPISCIVGGQIDQLDERRIKDQLTHPNEPKDGGGKTRNVDRCEIANSAKLPVKHFDDPGTFRGIPMNRLVNRLPD